MKTLYKVHAEREIAVSHQLTFHDGKCSLLHGHNFLVEVDVEATKLIEGGSSDGMIIDFGHIKTVIDTFDHKHINTYFPDDHEMAKQPTAERMADYIAHRVLNMTPNRNIERIIVRVHEAKNQYAEVILSN